MTGTDDLYKAPVVFVSHSSDDKERFVLPFAEALRANGVDAWVDQWEMLPGDSLMDRIFEHGLANANAVLVVLSASSQQSHWVKEELNAAAVQRLAKGTRVIVVRLDDTEVPHALKSLLWVDVKPAAWEQELDRILRAIFEVPARPPLGPPPRFVTDVNDHSARSVEASPAEAVRSYVADQAQRVRLHQLVKAEVDAASERITASDRYPIHTKTIDGADLQARLESYDADVTGVTAVVANGVYFGVAEQDGLWLNVVARAVRDGSVSFEGNFQELWERVRRYPALRIAYTAGIAAVAAGREGLLQPLLTIPVRLPFEHKAVPLCVAVSPHRVMSLDAVRLFPRWQGQQFFDALSIYLEDTLRAAFADILDSHAYEAAFERFEFLRSLIEHHESGLRYAGLGKFGWYAANGRSSIRDDVEAEIDRLGESWPLLQVGAFGGELHAAQDALRRVDDQLERSRYW